MNTWWKKGQYFVIIGVWSIALAACSLEPETAASPPPLSPEATTLPPATAVPPTAAAIVAEATPTPTLPAVGLPPTPWFFAVPPDQPIVPLLVNEEITFNVAAQLGGTAAQAIALDGQIVYLGVGERLITIDISDPTAPRILGQSDPLPEFIQAVTVENRLAFSHAGRDLLIYDVSDPAAPTKISAFSSDDDPAQAASVDIIPAGDVVYIITHVSGPDFSLTRLTALDIRNPTQPVLVATRELPGYAGITVRENVAYIVHEGRLQLVDAATFNITLGEIRFDEGVNPYFVTAAENLAYLGVWDFRTDEFGEHLLLTVDVRNPARPQVIENQIRLPPSLAATALTGNAFFLAGTGSAHGFCPSYLQIVDITDAEQRHSIFEPQSCINDIAAGGSTLVAATDDKGLQIFDASDLPNLTLTTEFVFSPGFTDAEAIILNQDVAYLFSGSTSGAPTMLHTLDLTEPDAPVVAGPLFKIVGEDPGLTGLYIRGDRLFLGWVNRPMHVLDISQPANLRLVSDTGVLPEGSMPMVPDISGNVLFRSIWNAVEILDISDPANPELVNTLEAGNAIVFRLSVEADYLITSEFGESTSILQFKIYDISDPSQPAKAGQIQLEVEFNAIQSFGIAGDTFYAVTVDESQTNFQLFIVDISEAAQPEIGRFALPFGVQGTVLAGDTLYFTGWVLDSAQPSQEGGVWALDVSNRSQPYLSGHLPLPGSSGGFCWSCSLSLSEDGDLLYAARGEAGLFIVQLAK